MDYQSRFFQKNPDSRYVVLADNVKHPFNEYLFFLSEHGILGIFLSYYFYFAFSKNLKGIILLTKYVAYYVLWDVVYSGYFLIL